MPGSVNHLRALPVVYDLAETASTIPRKQRPPAGPTDSQLQAVAELNARVVAFGQHAATKPVAGNRFQAGQIAHPDG